MFVESAILTLFISCYVQFDDDSGLISDAFIEAVAAIVLQTAIRRFLAIRSTQKLRSQRSSTEQNAGQVDRSIQQRKTPSPTANAPQDRHEEHSQLASKQMQPSTANQEMDGQSPMSQEEFFYDLAAVQIQSVFRGWWVRDSINVDH